MPPFIGYQDNLSRMVMIARAMNHQGQSAQDTWRQDISGPMSEWIMGR
jgi:hypothetical protein